MNKQQRELISTIAHESHMLGRIYAAGGEKESPGEVFGQIEKMIDCKIKQAPVVPGPGIYHIEYVDSETVRLTEAE